MYTVEIPTFGWRREKIDEDSGWKGNLAPPTVTVDQEVAGEYSLSVGLRELPNKSVVVAQAEIQRWIADDRYEDGGYWGQPRLLDFDTIQLVRPGGR